MSSAICFSLDHSKVLSSGNRLKPRSRVTVLYTEDIKEPGGAFSSFLLYPCTIPRNNQGVAPLRDCFRVVVSKVVPYEILQ